MCDFFIYKSHLWQKDKRSRQKDKKINAALMQTGVTFFGTIGLLADMGRPIGLLAAGRENKWHHHLACAYEIALVLQSKEKANKETNKH